MTLLPKFLCNHKWDVHAKEVRKWKEDEMAEGTEHWLVPKWREQSFSETVEILVCNKCGKIHKIEY